MPPLEVPYKFIANGPLEVLPDSDPVIARKAPFPIKSSKFIQRLNVSGTLLSLNPKSLGITILLEPVNFPAKPYLPITLKSTFAGVPS